ncbi:hypothetical protein K7432_016962 [Basidiobolus ranarum]|uniref:F-box domain-containing protein n=1 Tax=Basidiobolus ranarum TaxID=34480 RepID=A0ABR2VM79_9FUNG
MASTITHDPIILLPVEVTTRILGLLDATDLCNASLVSRSWKYVCDEECLWMNLCQSVWVDKRGMSLTIQPRADFSGDCAHRLTLPELKLILSLRKQETNGSEDKIKLVELVQKTTPCLTKAVADFHSKWKACYAFAQADYSRKDITIEDICGEWVLEVGKTQKCDLIDVSFNRDYTYYSENTGILKWNFYGKLLQIEDFPPLRPSRTTNWGWKLSCPYFNFYTK